MSNRKGIIELCDHSDIESYDNFLSYDPIDDNPLAKRLYESAEESAKKQSNQNKGGRRRSANNYNYKQSKGRTSKRGSEFSDYNTFETSQDDSYEF